jgi:hypothetical protein
VDALDLKTWLQDPNIVDYDPEKNNINGVFKPMFSAQGKLDDLKPPKLLSVMFSAITLSNSMWPARDIFAVTV